MDKVDYILLFISKDFMVRFADDGWWSFSRGVVMKGDKKM